MKFDKAETQGETIALNDDNGGETAICDGKDEIRLHCRNCAAPMVMMKENAVQCDILTDSQQGPSNLLTVCGSRRGSVQSVTEVREDVAYDDGVSAVADTEQAPDEILLVTRSFENEAQPAAPRRSSISQFFTNIKSLGNRRISEPVIKKCFLDESDAAMPQGLRSGIRRGSVGVGLNTLEEDNSEEESSKYGSSNELGPREPQLKRHSIQMSHGQVVQEDIEECAVDTSVQMDDDVTPGEINIVTRCFETTPEYAPRRESLIDKLNFVKMIGKNRKRKEQPENTVIEEDEEPAARYAAASGVRRKSIAPASLTYNGEELDEVAEFRDIRAGLAAPEPSDVLAARYVTAGIRRGSVAAVSAAPPCRGGAPEEEQTPNGPMLKPDDDDEERIRYVTSGIRRGSVAAVSAAPPCRNPDEDSGGSSGIPLALINEFDGQPRRGSYERIETYQMDVEDQDALRSGVRRRSLIPATTETSPLADREPGFDPVANETIYSSGEIPTDDESARKISSGSVEQRFGGKKADHKRRKKGVNDLFESLTGREAGVDYSATDADAIEKKRLESQKKTSNALIPQIMLSMDDSISDGESGAPEDETENQIAAVNEEAAITTTDKSSGQQYQNNDTSET